MHYFITGATGFIGGVVARQLRQAGHEVTALVRSPHKAGALADLGVTLCQGDITDKASLRAPMSGADGVFHIAGWYKIGSRDPSAAEPTNVLGTRNVLETMQELGITKGVYTSTVAINSDTHGRLVDETYHYEGNFLSTYERTKAAAHRVALELIAGGLPLVIVMPGAVYGPGDTSTVRTTFVQYLRRRLPVLPRRTALSWSHVEDCAAAHIAAMQRGRPGEAYFISGPVHTLVEMLALAEQITGLRAPLALPPQVSTGLSWLMSVVEKIIPISGTYSSEGLRVVAGVTYIASDAKARRELSFNPRPFKEGLAETLRHEQQLLRH